jgi:hypothetical protein
MPFISQKDLNKIGAVAAGFGIVDFFLEGKLGAPISRAFKKAGAAVGTRALGAAPAAARFTGATALRGAGTAALIGKQIALRHPVLTAGAVVYYTYKNREELADLIREGYDVVQDIAETRQDFIQRNPEQFVDLPFIGPVRPIGGVLTPKRRKTKFNIAVSAGMKAVKGSTSYGKKGTINNAKKAFTAVTKTVSKINKGAKVAKSGITRKIGLAVKGILK